MNWFLLFLLFCFCTLYFFVYFLYPYFFEERRVPLARRSISSILSVAFLGIFFYFVSVAVPGDELGNRALHAFGGVLATVICYMAARDTGVRLTRFRFFVFTFMAVMTLGVGNEIIEFLLHNYGGLTFSTALNDTWLDLISNTVGAVFAGAFLSTLIKK